MFLVSIIILSLYLSFTEFGKLNLRTIFFNVISIIPGTGYVNDQFDNWGSFTIVLFLSLMFIGGCAGSTTCGVKVFRFQILYLFIVNQLKKMIYPKGIFVIKYAQHSINEKFITSIISFIFLKLVLIEKFSDEKHSDYFLIDFRYFH